MLTNLRGIGPLLVSTCAPQVNLGTITSYPELRAQEDSAIWCDSGGEWSLKLDGWAYAIAKDVKSECGHRYAVDFLDAQRILVHRVVLTAEASLARFVEWVQIHQAAKEDLAPAKRHGYQAAAVPSFGAGRSTLVGIEAMGELLRLCVEEQTQVRVVVENAGALQGHCFGPTTLRINDAKWLYCADDKTALHLDWNGFHRVTVGEHEGDEREWTLQAYDANGVRRVHLRSSAIADLARWNARLSALADTFKIGFSAR